MTEDERFDLAFEETMRHFQDEESLSKEDLDNIASALGYFEAAYKDKIKLSKKDEK